MKNQYFGDINDYRKYGLLRCLQEVTKLPLGVCWLLTPNDERNDGERRLYLQEEQREHWSRFDLELYELLSRLRNPRVDRTVELAQEWNLLPGASYFEKLLEGDRPLRDEYFKEAWKKLADRSLLFFDPDNGIEVPSCPRVKRRSPKHIYWDEIKEAYDAEHSLVLYQHFPRIERNCFVERTVKRIKRELSTSSVHVFKTASVAFFLAIRPEHESRFTGIHKCVAQRWNSQIEPIPESCAIH